jgi:glycosyltransferase involved in cell wall biosynthesis
VKPVEGVTVNIQGSPTLTKSDKIPGTIFASFTINISTKATALQLLKSRYGSGAFKVEFIGEGNLKDKIVERFKEVGMEDRVIMLGFLGARAVARYYKKGFVLIHTAFWEGWGLPMVEASACGLPVVTTDTGCAGEVVIDNVNGIVLDSKIAEDYIVKIDELINDRSKFKEMCEAGNKLSTEWTFESMRTKTEKFLIDSLN